MKNGAQMTRDELKNAIATAINNMHPVHELEQIIDQKTEAVARKQEKAAQKEMADSSYKGFSITRGILRFFGWYIVGAMLLLPFAFLTEAVAGNGLNADNMLENIAGLASLFSIVMLVFGKTIRRIIRNISLKKYEEKALNAIREAEEGIKNYVSSHPEVFGFMPVKYVRTPIMVKIDEYLQNLRADNLKDALNLYEAECRQAAF